MLQKLVALEACSLLLYIIWSRILGKAKMQPSPLPLTLALELEPPVACAGGRGWAQAGVFSFPGSILID